MPLNLAMSIMSVAEFLLWATVGYFFWTKKLHRRYRAVSGYFALRLGSTPVLLTLLYLQSHSWGDFLYPVYFFAYWSVYIASAILLFAICVEIFSNVLAAFSGIMRFAKVVFRWAALASIIVSLSTVSIGHKGAAAMIPDIADGLMRSVSVIELCLLAFLCLAMNALRLSPRDLSFGLALGFGLMSANDFVTISFMSWSTTLSAPLQIVYEVVLLSALVTWVVYLAFPETARKPVVVAANSTIYRWNEIASALGHPTTNVAVPQAANGFFLTDVEKVVEKVLTRNLKENESNS